MKKIYIYLVLFSITCSLSAQEYKRMISVGTYTVQEIQNVAEAHFSIVGTERGKGYKPYKRWEYKALREMDENGFLKSPDFYYNELQRYNNYINQNFTQFRTTVGAWEEVGPTNWNQTAGWNPGVGRVSALAVDPGNSNHIIAGANTGGVWRTTDGGLTWTVLTDNMSNLITTALAIDPTDSSRYFWGTSGGVIFTSSNDGSTWDVLSDTGNGTVNKILIDPTDVTKMYCTVANGGIYKSTNSGVDWTRIHSSATSGYDVEFKPGDTDVIYASGNQYFFSTDGGDTFNAPNGLTAWTQELVTGSNSWTTTGSNQNGTVAPRTGNAMAFCYIGNFSQPVTNLISPSLDLSGATSPELKFSYTQVDWSGDQDELRVLYKTSTAGAWIELANYTTEVMSWSDITLALPNQSTDYYITFEGHANYGRGLTIDDVSVEDGATVIFQDGFESAPNEFGGGAKMMAVSANDPSIVYLLEESGGAFGGLHVSDDSGATFTKLNHNGKNYFGYSSDSEDPGDSGVGQAPRDMDIAINPANANQIHIAGVNTWYSTDGGDTFSISSQWVPGSANSQGIGYCHADVDILEYVGTKLYVGSDGGIFVANDPTNVTSGFYTDLTSGMGIRQFYRFGVSQTDPEVIVGGSQDNGSSVMDTSGNWTDWLGADGMETFVDKNNTDIIYGTIYNGNMYKSVTGGSNYFGIDRPDGKSGSWVTPFEQDPVVQNTIYSAFDQVYKSIDGGNTWDPASQDFGTSNLDELKIAPSNNNVMYTSERSTLYKTEDGGATDWVTVTGFAGNINCIAIHPLDSDKIAIATTSGQKVYVSTDGGDNWTSYLNDLPNFSAKAVVWQDNGNDGLYVGMNYGVYYIDNTTGNSWQPFSNNLPNVDVRELEINTANNKLYAATYGRGVWKSDVYDPSLSVDEFELNSVSLYPNPASTEVNLTWNKSEEVGVKIYNALGKLMYSENNINLSNSLKITISKYAAGLYFVRINTVEGIVTKKLLIN